MERRVDVPHHQPLAPEDRDAVRVRFRQVPDLRQDGPERPLAVGLRAVGRRRLAEEQARRRRRVAERPRGGRRLARRRVRGRAERGRVDDVPGERVADGDEQRVAVLPGDLQKQDVRARLDGGDEGLRRPRRHGGDADARRVERVSRRNVEALAEQLHAPDLVQDEQPVAAGAFQGIHGDVADGVRVHFELADAPDVALLAAPRLAPRERRAPAVRGDDLEARAPAVVPELLARVEARGRAAVCGPRVERRAHDRRLADARPAREHDDARRGDLEVRLEGVGVVGRHQGVGAHRGEPPQRCQCRRRL